MKLDNSTSNICFDDILLVPKKSKIISRSDINIESILGNPNNPKGWITLYTPIMIAPMDFISTTEMIKQIIKYGGIGFVHRWQPLENRILQLKKLLSYEISRRSFGFSISITEANDKYFIENLLNLGVNIFLIDTAFGHNDLCINAVKSLRSIVPDYIHIMTGNISSYDAYNDLMEAGADSIRVGIGGGAACNTRFATGFGVPVLSSIMDIYENINQNEVNGIISDGAIKQTGDIVKALAAGASAVMMGSMFAGHNECEKNEFRGIASLSLQLDMLEDKPENTSHIYIEGIHGNVKNKGNVEDTIYPMINSIRSGLSYCGAQNLKTFRENCNFIKVSPQSIHESSTRI